MSQLLNIIRINKKGDIISFSLNPLTNNCNEILKKKEHICFGISPYNSLFSQEYISSLIKYAKENFNSFHLFVPDEPTIYTLQAIGYNETDAKRKLKKQINWLNNKIKKALLENGINQEKNYLINSNFLTSNTIFNNELNSLYYLTKKDHSFYSLCLKASKWVISNKTTSEIKKEHLEIAVKYLLYEIPLFAKTNTILNKNSSIFCYHQSIHLHHLLYNKDLPYLPDKNQGYCTISLNPKTNPIYSQDK